MYSLKTASDARANLLTNHSTLRKDIILLIETLNSIISTESTIFLLYS